MENDNDLLNECIESNENETNDYVIIYHYSKNETTYFIKHDDDLNTLTQIKIFEMNKKENRYHCFGLFDNYEKSHQSLIKFKNDMITWTNEIKNVKLKRKSGKYFSLNYYKYYNHNSAVLLEFKSHSQNMLDLIEPMNKEEFYIHERCRNSGLIILNDEFKNKPVQCYSYDYTRFYVHELFNMQVPKNRGKKQVFENIDFEKLDFGIYRIQIHVKNKDFYNMFNTSKDHHYTSRTMKELYKCRAKYELEFTLLKPDNIYDYNAYIYEISDLIKGRDIFGTWVSQMNTLMKEAPKNKLVKNLMSTLWGQLTSFKKFYSNDLSQFDVTHRYNSKESDYKILKIMDNDDFQIFNTNEPYHFSLARIKTFLTANSRLKMFKLIESNNLEKNVVRVHTDGLCLNKQFNFNKTNKPYSFYKNYYPIPEDKTSGLIKWYNSQVCKHICSKCNNEFSYKDFVCHSC